MRRLLFLLAACTEVDPVETRPLAHPDRTQCEQQAASLGQQCATVWMFEMPASNPLGHVEKCVPFAYLDEAVKLYGGARPSDDERFEPYARLGIDPPCIWSCPEVADCNAYDSCECPSPPAP